MASRIRVLDENTINKIAAGEVIENPSSVVKELVENSLDAGATDICVEISVGGRQLIRVTDNGCGMNADDALLCLERHGTSKIRSIDDLHDVASMGFRGEAIPSIASISKFTLLTCPQDPGGSATLVIVEGGKIIKCCSAERSPGTTIEVKSLFFNVPVRRKFQKSPQHDANEIFKIMSLLILAHPQIKFQLIDHHKTVLSSPLQSQESFLEVLGERISSVLGADFRSSLMSLDEAKFEYSLKGYVSHCFHTRHNRTGQYLFINSRPVFSSLVSYAVKEGYGTTIGTQRYPLFVLHLTLPSTLVDVNVHPQKREVRMRQEQQLREFIMHAIEKNLHKEYITQITPEVIFSPSLDLPVFNDEIPPQPIPQPVPQMRTFFENPTPQMPSLPLLVPSLSLQAVETMPGYIMACRDREDLCAIDQQAAHQRILYETLVHQKNNHDREAQHLLIPEVIELSPPETAMITEYLQELNHLGMGIKEFGFNTFLIDALPLFLKQIPPREVLSHIIQDLNTGLLEREKLKQLAVSASRASITSRKRLSLAEAQGLLDQLIKCEMPHQCPQGKPTMVSIPIEEIQKLFQR